MDALLREGTVKLKCQEFVHEITGADIEVTDLPYFAAKVFSARRAKTGASSARFPVGRRRG